MNRGPAPTFLSKVSELKDASAFRSAGSALRRILQTNTVTRQVFVNQRVYM